MIQLIDEILSWSTNQRTIYCTKQNPI